MREFLKRVVGDSDGGMVITSPRSTGYGWSEVWSEEFEKVEPALESFKERDTGIYFGLGRFNQSDKGYQRRQLNCKSLKSFWFDIDAGEDKFRRRPDQAYETQEEALQALVAFIKESGIQKPTYIVSSGAGLHVYWVMDTPIVPTEWRPAAIKFGAIAKHFGLRVDSTRTADHASVLRVPGTMHKSGVPVTILRKADLDLEAEDFIDTLDNLVTAHNINFVVRERKQRDLSEHPITFFKNIMEKGENGCKQLNNAYTNQADVPEPLWWGVLSVAEFCTDRDEWIHKLSDQHPGYSHEATERKASQSQGPRTCSWFQAENPSGCTDCEHRARFGLSGSPISLGADTAPIVIENTTTLKNGKLVIEEYEAPPIPSPYKRGLEGGIVYSVKTTEIGEDGKKKDTWVDRLLYRNDFYIYDRQSVSGIPRYSCRHHTQRDGVADFELDVDVVTADASGLRKALGRKEIILTHDEDYKEMSKYLRRSAQAMQDARAQRVAPEQFGWTRQGSFVLGTHEFSKSGIRECPMADSNVAKAFAYTIPDYVGDDDPHAEQARIDAWNAVMTKMYGSPDAQIHRLILAAGIGAPARSRHSIERGGLINLFTERSGAGKTTLIMNSLGYYMDAEDIKATGKDGATQTAFYRMLSYANSMPLLFDEIGQIYTKTPDEVMKMLHNITSGKFKFQGSASTSDIRDPLLGWKTFIFSTSNISMWSSLASRIENDAYYKRSIELHLNALDFIRDNKTEGEELRREAKSLMGCCGPRLVKYMIEFDDEIHKDWIEVSARLDKEAGLVGTMRYWGELMAAAVIGARIGVATGTFPFDPEEVHQTAVKHLKELITYTEDKEVDDSDLLAQFIHENSNRFITMTSDTVNLGYTQPYDTVVGRIEQHTKKVWIMPGALVDFAQEKGFDVNRLVNFIKSMGGIKSQKRMFVHTKGETGRAKVYAWMIDASEGRAAEFFPMEE